MIPGEYALKDGDIELCAGRDRITIEVGNTGDRPVQIGSHYHFAEPGQSREVTLIPFSGKREIYGFRGDVMGKLDGKQ